MPAMVLAAGLGTRLRPLTEICPKPLVPVGDRSVLAHVAGDLRAAGFERLVVNAHHLPEQVHAAAHALGAVVSLEEEILGTAGGVAAAAALLGDGPALVCNGDILARIAHGSLVAAHRPGVVATLALGPPRPLGVGTVGVDEHGNVARLRAGRFGVEVASGDFAGTQILSPEGRAALPARGCLVGDLYLPALQAGRRVAACFAAGTFWDIGTPADYLAANLDWLARHRLESWCAPGVDQPSGVRLQGCVVGRAATLDGVGTLRHVVVWPGARASAPLADAVVARDGVVVAAGPMLGAAVHHRSRQA